MPANYLQIRPMDINRAVAAGSRMGQSLGELLTSGDRAKARQEAMEGGDLGHLARYSPEEALAIQRGHVDIARTRAGMNAKRMEEMRRRELVAQKAMEQSVGRLSSVAQSTPEAYEAAYQSERQKLAPVLGQAGVELPEFIPADQLGQFGQDLRTSISETSDPKRYQSFQLEAAARLAADAGDQTLNDPQFAMRHPDWKKYQDTVLADRQKRAPRTSISVDATPLTRGTETDVQKSAVGNMQMLGSLQEIGRLAKPEYFAFWDRVKNKGVNFVAKLDPRLISSAQQGDIGARRRLFGEIDQYFNAYRKSITGAAASEQELKMLKDSVINGDLSWPEFQASLGQIIDKTNRELRLERRLLREGIDTADERAEQRALLMMRGDQGNSKADAKHRFNELQAAGMEDYEAVMALLAEGYINEARAEKMLGFDPDGGEQ